MDDADRLLAAVAGDLRPRRAALTDLLMRLYAAEIPALGEAEVNGPARALVTESVDLFLDVLGGIGPGLAGGQPQTAVKLARMLADRDIPVSAMLRAYRLGLAGLTPLLFEDIARRSGDTQLVSAATLRLAVFGLEWMDLASEQAFSVYQAQRERRVQRQLRLVNEASTGIGTTLDIGRTAQELADVGVRHFADYATVSLLDPVLGPKGQPPRPGRLRLCRVAQRTAPAEGAGEIEAPGEPHTFPAGSVPDRALTTGQPSRHRLDGPPDWLRADPGTAGAVRAQGLASVLVVPLRARGAALGLALLFRRGEAVPFTDDDLLLVRDLAARAAVSIDNARRYTHERATALTLQRALLPQRPPEQSAVEVASRYLPAGSHAGVGGDWYDVIPLAGARVALVVGDVVGHGLYASASMGRLRTAVRTLADVDLAPDELLTHLDDVVIRLADQDPEEGQESSATCLYAVYDPVSGNCTLASAGQLLPAVVGPDGRVDFPQLPIGPPLGLGALPFEKSELHLPEGSLLALYTDGLVESQGRDVDSGLAALTEVLAETGAASARSGGAPVPLEDVCEALIGRLVPARPTDDVALLLARTRVLASDQVSVRELAADPAVVSEARRHTLATLADWGLEEASFTAELVVSELVTNAIRYGEVPIRLRLIRDRALICEVSDASSTSPHMRRARVFDEGGRGLLLVAQLADRWGTRYTREGKIIWAELPLLPDAPLLPDLAEPGEAAEPTGLAAGAPAVGEPGAG
ncbi:ATP-binding SpoIIE family protein phosphatase [Streptomyces physcomitrii]|uniref:ATP-binding SpoIIE family protein phosphatase n=1 Tax=Streptomyces physcomitrii TaxID=2724184 RepID=UPI00340B25B2